MKPSGLEADSSIIGEPTGFRYGAGMEEVFTRIYQTRRWGGSASASGPGSDLVQTQVIRLALKALIRELGVKTFLDLGCGDLHWIKTVDLAVERYIGVDIVEELIKLNAARFTDREFLRLDFVQDPLPTADLVFCRDCLVHFPFPAIFNTIENIKRSGSKYLLTTTFTAEREPQDILTGRWRPINLELPPFEFSKPIVLINEGCTENEGKYEDKSLGLWIISELP